MALGVIPNKTYSMAFPIIPEIVFRDFVRGYFDGDGSISQYRDKNRPNYVGLRTFFICHDRNFLVILGDLLKQELQIIPKIYQLSESWRLQYGGRESICLYDLMYKCPDTQLYLRRKRSQFEDWLKQRGLFLSYKRKCRCCLRVN